MTFIHAVGFTSFGVFFLLGFVLLVATHFWVVYLRTTLETTLQFFLDEEDLKGMVPGYYLKWTNEVQEFLEAHGTRSSSGMFIYREDPIRIKTLLMLHRSRRSQPDIYGGRVLIAVLWAPGDAQKKQLVIRELKKK